METKELASWADFEAELAQLRDSANVPLGTALLRSDLLFRGQSDANWSLDTTLERAGCMEWSWARYFCLMERVLPAIAAHTGREWALPRAGHYAGWAANFDSRGDKWWCYEFMAYLRHHGFPSPLLDWSASPYVAAFFAFRSDRGESDRVAIFAYRERGGAAKVTSSDKPFITQLPAYVSTHARHFRQQCQYTICSRYNHMSHDYITATDKTGGFEYAHHEQVFSQSLPNQDQLWKFTLPRSERRHVLALLSDFNLNAYSLFASEDALIETLAYQELPL